MQTRFLQSSAAVQLPESNTLFGIRHPISATKICTKDWIEIFNLFIRDTMKFFFKKWAELRRIYE